MSRLDEVLVLREICALQDALLAEWVKLARSPGSTPLSEMHRKMEDLATRTTHRLPPDFES